MEHVMKQTQECTSKRTELDTNKERFLEKYSNQLSAKKRKPYHKDLNSVLEHLYLTLASAAK